MDDDICILKHETAYGVAGESPVSVCAGDESVASHFALVTAYEDIKKRLRDTERENTLLRKRVKQLEDKVLTAQRVEAREVYVIYIAMTQPCYSIKGLFTGHISMKGRAYLCCVTALQRLYNSAINVY